MSFALANGQTMFDRPLSLPAADDPIHQWEIRRGVFLAVAVQFVLLMGVAVIQGFWPAGGIGGSGSIVVLVGAGLLIPLVVGRMLNRTLARIDAVEAERLRLKDLYGRARHESLMDVLTGLGNHRAFQEELARQLEFARRHHTPLALLLVDVDELKGVNDARGHVSGDQLLAAVGKVATAAMRRSDRAFRVGGDEFAIVLPGSTVDEGLAVARRILAAALSGGDPGAPIDPFSLSIGVSAIPTPSAEGHQLYRHADAALYWCKRHGRTSAVVYDPGRHGRTTDDRSVEDLAAAVSGIVAARQLTAMYQPIVSLETGRPIGFEGLVRPAEGSAFADASSLFAAAEIADRSVELDLACLKIIAEGIRPEEPGAYLSVNVSPRTLESEEFRPSELTAIFRRRGIQPDQIVLELTERETVDDLDTLRRNVEACRRAGMRIAADDVGAGNAGLRLLSEIQFDILKVDLSLVQGGIVHDPSYAVLGALQELAGRWNAMVVAEGVETPEQLSVIRHLGIAAAQGYLLGRPGPVPALQVVDLEALTGMSTLHPEHAFGRVTNPIDMLLGRSERPRVTGFTSVPIAPPPPPTPRTPDAASAGESTRPPRRRRAQTACARATALAADPRSPARD